MYVNVNVYNRTNERETLLQLTNIDVNETVEGDERAFEIWHEREDSVRKYTLQARTVMVKNSWLRDLRNLQERYSMPAWSKFPTSFTRGFYFKKCSN